MRIPHGLRAALASQATPPAPSSDANFENVSLLLHGDGTNGAQNNTFIDDSANNFTITRNGNTTQGTFSPFSPTGWSGYFDGTGDYLNFGSSPYTGFGTGDFTLECWVYIQVSGTMTIYDGRYSASATGFALSYDTTNGLKVFYGGANRIVGGTIAANAWNHVAVARASGSTKLYVNGSQVGSTYADTNNYTSGAQNAFIGAAYNASGFWNGYISNFRIVNGTAVYTSNFTPPTSPLTAITNTSLLTLQDNRFKDNSTNNFTITRNGDTKIEAFSPFNPTAAYSASTHGGSGYFDGSGDYLSFANNAAFAFGTGNFTWEFWIYRASTTANLTVLDQRTTGGTANGISDYINASNKYVLYGNNLDLYTSTASITPFQWTHIAVARSGSTLRVFINGSLDGSVSNSMNLSDQSLLIGVNRGITAGSVTTGYFNGYISNLRVLKGTAQYTSNFTPPTAPLTAITNTSLLLNFTNGGIIDNASKNVLETVGNAQISTSVKKFGTGSMYFDGTGDYLFHAPVTNNAAFGTGDFTIETWFYPLSNQAQYATIIAAGNQTGAGQYWQLYFSNSINTLSFSDYGTVLISAAGNISNSTWTHVALTRSGTTLRLFLDGVQSSSATSSLNLTPLGQGIKVGQGAFTTPVLNGYIDDLRITKGVARYTANFTPPTAAFPDL